MPKATEFTVFSGAVADADHLILLDASEAVARVDKRIAVDHLRKQLVRAVTSSSDPTVNDDDTEGYVAGNFWLNTSDGGLFRLVDASTGAADWDEFGTGMLASDPISINAQTGTTYTLALGDSGKLITLDNGSAITVTVPTDSVAFPVGTVIALQQLGAGQVTVEGDTGVTINGVTPGDVDLTDAQYESTAALTKHATNTWTLTGAIE